MTLLSSIISLVARQHVNETQLLWNVHTSSRIRKSGVVDMAMCPSDPLQGKACYSCGKRGRELSCCGPCLASWSWGPLFRSHVPTTPSRAAWIPCLSKRVFDGVSLHLDRRQPWWVILAPELPARRAVGAPIWLFPLANSVSSPFPSQRLLINILYSNYFSVCLPETESATESCSAGRTAKANRQGGAEVRVRRRAMRALHFSALILLNPATILPFHSVC